MIWIYTVKDTDFVAIDITSLKQLREIANNQWVWIDIFNPNERELEIITELIGNGPEIIEKFKKIKNQPVNRNLKTCILCNYEKIKEYGSVTIPSIAYDKHLFLFPIFLATKKKMIITWGEENSSHSEIVKITIKRLREGVEAGQELNSSLVIGVLFREIAIQNSHVLLDIREEIDKLEEKALEFGGKELIKSVFVFKKIISCLYRLMIEEKDFMLDVSKSVIPLIRLNKKSEPIVNEAIDIIDREIDFIDSYYRTIDSILTLADLSSIHKVESSINYLTIVLVIGTVMLIIFELLGILNLH
jgi:Mg2+ and Co2+ transporter CorA